MRLRYDRSTVAARAFFYLPEMFLMELLPNCDLESAMSLARTSHYSRNLVKCFFATNQRDLLEIFFGEANVDKFYDVLESSSSGMAGSFTSGLLTPPYNLCLTKDLNLLVPRYNLFMWRDFLDHIHLFEKAQQPGVDRRYYHTTHSHVVYHARTKDFTISISESIDDSLFTPLIGATTTLNTTLCTASKFYSLYGYLLSQHRALEGWFPTPVRKAVAIGRRGYSSSFSTASWQRPCGVACPVLWHHVRGLQGVGVFTWGGYKSQHGDFSEVGVPVTDNDMKWRLGDTCTNDNCPSHKGNYFAISRQ